MAIGSPTPAAGATPGLLKVRPGSGEAPVKVAPTYASPGQPARLTTTRQARYLVGRLHHGSAVQFAGSGMGVPRSRSSLGASVRKLFALRLFYSSRLRERKLPASVTGETYVDLRGTPRFNSMTAKRITFRAGSEMAEMIKDIATSSQHASTSDLIRTAIAVAYLSWCEYSTKLVLKHRDGRQKGLDFPEPPKVDTNLDQIIHVRSDEALLKYLNELLRSGFAGNATAIIRRSLSQYRFMLQCREAGWDCGYM